MTQEWKCSYFASSVSKIQLCIPPAQGRRDCLSCCCQPAVSSTSLPEPGEATGCWAAAASVSGDHGLTPHFPQGSSCPSSSGGARDKKLRRWGAVVTAMYGVVKRLAVVFPFWQRCNLSLGPGEVLSAGRGAQSRAEAPTVVHGELCACCFQALEVSVEGRPLQLAAFAGLCQRSVGTGAYGGRLDWVCR